MTSDLIKELSSIVCRNPRDVQNRLIETHISYVILTEQYAYKVKKPVKLPFLDFSSLSQRRFYCETELSLNQRLAPEMYIKVLPIFLENGKITLRQSPTADLIDYTLQMHRINNDLEMNTLLHQDKVNTSQIDQLAHLLAEFHLKHRLPPDAQYQPDEDLADFMGLFPFADSLSLHTGASMAELDRWKVGITKFIKTHQDRMVERQQEGFQVDGHGDLHTRNIFLTDPPTVFDCIEFNPHFRRLDVLNELAFLCMDLEYHQHESLANQFMNTYQKHWECLVKPEDQLLFTYYKAYRANVRLKITLMEIESQGLSLLRQTAVRYWMLMQKYGQELGI